MASALKTRLLIISYYWSINARGMLIVASIFVLLVGSIFYVLTLRSSPVFERHAVTGHVVSATTRETWPQHATGRGFSYRYGIQLENSDTVVFAVQSAARPIAIGTTVKLERIEHENGWVEYNFAD